jgi:hypothetical protein
MLAAVLVTNQGFDADSFGGVVGRCNNSRSAVNEVPRLCLTTTFSRRRMRLGTVENFEARTRVD